jgi:molybdopterin molybdotransferase
MDFFTCKSLDEAKTLIYRHVPINSIFTETVALENAVGRIAAQDMIAAEDLPPFTRSTVDGYAVNSRDTFGAGEASPAWMSLAGEIAMGETASHELKAGQTMAIPTGGMLPAGADAVVMVEHTELTDDRETIFVCKPVAPGENVIFHGEDIQHSSIIVKQGSVISLYGIGALAACGFEHVQVYRRPRISIISTGDELVTIGSRPKPGEIRDVNSYTLSVMLEQAGCEIHRAGIIKDCYQDIYCALSQAAATSQLVVISGGSSVGARDHTVHAIKALGNPGIIFHGLAVKPGKPTIFGVAGSVPVFGLPGHPVSAMMICEQIVIPTVDRIMGRVCRSAPVIRAKMARNIPSAPGRDDFVNVRVMKCGEEYFAEPILGKSGLISILLSSDGVIRIGQDKSGLYKDELVDVILR